MAVHRANIRLDKPVKVRGDVSSQFLTALLMALPLAARIRRSKSRVSHLEALCRHHAQPDAALRNFGETRCVAHIRRAGAAVHEPRKIFVEGDASSASYFLAAGAIGGGPVRVEGSAGPASRATCASPRCLNAWARRSRFWRMQSK